MRYFRLIRWPNLVLASATQLVFYWHVVVPIYGEAGIQPNLHTMPLILLLLATICTMAGGYILNDLEDEETDSFNRGPNTIIGTSIDRKSAYYFYFLAILASLLSSGYFLLQGMFYTWLAIISSLVALYFYSKRLKGTPILGNLLIAVLSSLVIFILWLSETPWRSEEIPLARLTQILMSFSSFAFLSTIIREIVKDIEDLDGDRQSGIRTIATVWGVSASSRVVLLVSAVLLFSLVLVSANEWVGFSLFGKSYAVILILFLLAIMIQISRSTRSKDFTKISGVLKIFMAAGLFFVIFWDV